MQVDPSGFARLYGGTVTGRRQVLRGTQNGLGRWGHEKAKPCCAEPLQGFEPRARASRGASLDSAGMLRDGMYGDVDHAGATGNGSTGDAEHDNAAKQLAAHLHWRAKRTAAGVRRKAAGNSGGDALAQRERRAGDGAEPGMGGR